MTKAVCFQCGHIKFGSFMPCDQCQTRPRTDDEMIVSLAMSDHYFADPTLEQMSQYIQEHHKPPQLDPESERVFRQNFEEVKASGALDQLFEEGEET